MLKSQTNLLRSIILIVLIVKISTQKPVGLVPKIQTHPIFPEEDVRSNFPQQYKYVLLPEGENRYRLRLEVGDNIREETVELKSRGTPEEELFVKGSINTLLTTVTYEADKNGYRAHYEYKYSPVNILSTSAGFLKTAAG